MLSSIQPKLCCPTCGRQDATLTLHVFRDSDTAGAVRDGVLICDRCGEWYQIDEHVLDLEPLGLQDPSDRAAFSVRFKAELEKIGLLAGGVPEIDPGSAHFGAQWKQRAHFDAF